MQTLYFQNFILKIRNEVGSKKKKKKKFTYHYCLSKLYIYPNKTFFYFNFFLIRACMTLFGVLQITGDAAGVAKGGKNIQINRSRPRCNGRANIRSAISGQPPARNVSRPRGPRDLSAAPASLHGTCLAEYPTSSSAAESSTLAPPPTLRSAAPPQLVN